MTDTHDATERPAPMSSTTPGEEAVRSANRASKEINKVQQALTEESRVLLVGLLRDEMRDAVRDGISEAMTEDNARAFFRTGIAVLREEAKSQAGGLVLDGLRNLAKLAFWALLILVGVYSIGGWAGLKMILFSRAQP